MVDAPSGGAPEQAPRWDLVDTEGCGGGIRFLAPVLIVRGYVGIYRRKQYVGGALRGPPGGAPSTLVGNLLLHRRTPSSYIYLRTPDRLDTEPKT